MKPLLILLAVAAFSCKPRVKELVVSKRLIGFYCSEYSSLGSTAFDSLEILADENIIEVKPHENLLLITAFAVVNDCGHYEPDIFIDEKHGRIELSYVLVSDEVCTSLGAAKLIYIVSNPKEKEYSVEFKVANST